MDSDILNVTEWANDAHLGSNWNNHWEAHMAPTYKENRRSNLLALEKKYGSLEALKQATGVSASYLSQMKKFRQMGDKVARQIEKKLNLPQGWMDYAQPPGIGGNKAVLNVDQPIYGPNSEAQQLLEDFLSIPDELRAYLTRRAKALKRYAETLTAFQRNNMRRPPEEQAAFEEWVKELEEELARMKYEPAPTKRKARV